MLNLMVRQKSYLSRLRTDIQFLYNSKMSSATGTIFLNSIPKSGTHFFKALLIGMGYEFRGHLGSKSRFTVELKSEGLGFYTGHTRQKIEGIGKKFLTVRDPVAIALSQVHYVKSRKDHHMHTRFKTASIESAMLEIFQAKDVTGAPHKRFAGFLKWAIANDAYVLDFDDVRSNPLLLSQVVVNLDANENNIRKALERWSPTKRNADRARESEYIREFSTKHRELIEPTQLLYQSLLEKRSYDL